MSETFEIRRAERKQARLRFAISGASNAGKTWTALEIAFGIVEELLSRKVLSGTLEGKVGLVDTERRSSQLYAHLGPFDTIDLGPPYTVERYVGAVQALERAGVAVIILDSISHAWAGPGGVLALLDAFEAAERFSAFGKKINPTQDEFVDTMLRSPCHVIATMRSKTAWILEDKEVRGGRIVKAPRRIGMAPIQRPGIEYEFTTLVDLDTDTHAARVVKNRCPVFSNWTPRILTREHGRQLAAWLLEGAPEPAGPVSGTPAERAQATLEAGLRACERAETVPDLARIFENCQRALRGFPPAVAVEQIKPMLEQLVKAKDAKKAELSGDLGNKPPGPVVDPAVASDLETLMHDAQVTIEAFREKFGFARLALLPADRLQDAVDWLNGEALAETGRPLMLTKRLTAMGMVVKAVEPLGALAGMADDLPWRD